MKLNPDAKATIVNIITLALEREHNYLYQSCLSCIHFHETKEICKLANQRPPAKVIVFGCEHWDFVPF